MVERSKRNKHESVYKAPPSPPKELKREQSSDDQSITRLVRKIISTLHHEVAKSECLPQGRTYTRKKNKQDI